MKIAILSSVAGVSSKVLAQGLKDNGIHADVFKTKDTMRRDFEDYDYVYSFGCSEATLHKKRLNKPEAIRRCVSKPLTFEALKKAGCSTVEYTTNREKIPKHWEWVVVREKLDGRKAEGIGYCENIPGKIPAGELFTEYFEHKYEYRIMVFRDEVVGRYFKAEENGDWYFNLQPKRGFEEMDRQCVRAAKELGIDYVGFDVVANTKKDFKILEANSAARLTDEAEIAIIEYFLNV